MSIERKYNYPEEVGSRHEVRHPERRRHISSGAGYRVTTLASIGSQVPDGLIAYRLGQRLQVETGKSVLVIHLLQATSGTSLAEWDAVRQQVNGEFILGNRIKELGTGYAELALSLPPSGLQEESFEALLRHCQEHFHYLVVHVAATVPRPTLLACIRHSHRTYLLMRPKPEDLYHREVLLKELRHPAVPNPVRIRTVFVREKGEPFRNELLRQVEIRGFAMVHGCPPPEVPACHEGWEDRLFREDLRRLAREIGRCRIGLALSSGGARGLAHVGVIQVLEENGIEVDVVSGCSMGSYVGAVWACGFDGVHMEKLAREVEHRWGLVQLLDPFLFPRQGFMRGERVKRRLKRSIGDIHILELPRPLRIVATNLATLERVVFADGEVAEAVHASSAIPGACAPVQIRGAYYIDGGICDPLPVDLLEEIGIEKIIAVNTIPTPAYLRYSEEFHSDGEAAHEEFSNPVAGFLNQHLNYFAPGNILDTIFRSFHGAQIRVAEQSCQKADLVLRPLCADGRWHDFRHPGKYIIAGRQEAECRLDQIKALASRKEESHEHTHTDASVAKPV